MSKLNSALNSKIKSQLDEIKIRKIRKTLLSLAEMDIRASKSFNVVVIKKDENENKMVMPTIIKQKNYHEDLEKVNQNEINMENETNFDSSELADSSDFENEEDE